MSALTLFLREAPGWFLVLGIFLPIAVLLLLIIAHLRWKIVEVEASLAEARRSRETLLKRCYGLTLTEAGNGAGGKRST